MKAILILVLALLAQSQHIAEDKLTLMNSGALRDDLQSIDFKNATVTEKDMKKAPKEKLPEFDDHAELQTELQTESPEDPTPPPPTPNPKLVDKDTTSDGELDGNETTTTAQPELLPSPVPVQLNPVANKEDLESTPDDAKPTSTKKPSVPKKGVSMDPGSKADAKPPSTKKSSVPKKGVSMDPESQAEEEEPTSTKKPSVPKKGVSADQESEDPSITRKPSVPRKGAVPESGLEPVLMSDSNGTIGHNDSTENVIPTPKMVVSGKANGISNKSTATHLNMPTTERKKPTIGTTKHFGSVGSVPNKFSLLPQAMSTSTPQGLIPSPRPVDTEPAKPPTANPVTTESYIAAHSKPTAATDSLDIAATSKDDDNMTYTPAVVGIVLLVAAIVTVIVVGYRRLQDVWMRRHYARMDFLIDGMYDV